MPEELKQDLPEQTEAVTSEYGPAGQPEPEAKAEQPPITPDDIIKALWDKDSHGDNLTVINFALELLDTLTGDVTKKLAELTTREPIVSVFDIGGYATLRVTYKYATATDFPRMLTILEDFAKELTEFSYGKHDDAYVPRLNVTVRPMSLKGAMITAINPIFHNVQPHDPIYAECNELQMLFTPDALQFYYDPDFDDKAVSDQVRAEIAAEESIRTAAERKKAEDEAYQAEREREAKERMDKDYNLSGGHVIKEAYHGFGKDREKGE